MKSTLSFILKQGETKLYVDVRNKTEVMSRRLSLMSKPTVLIIDDDIDLLGELMDMLSSADYDVVTCSHPLEAARIARESAPDVILVDMLMPELNGLQVIDRMRANGHASRIPIIIMSGCCEESEGRKLARVNALAGFIRKPMNPLEVIAEIERHLD